MKSKPKFALAILLAGPAMPGMCFAQEQAHYIGVEGGATFGGKRDFDVFTTPSPTRSGIILNDSTGYDIGFFVGHDFGRYRVEVEETQRVNNVHDVTTSVVVPTKRNPGAEPTTSKGSFGYATGRTRVRAATLNLIADLIENEGVELYAGVGFGYGWFNASRYSVSTTAVMLGGGKSGPAGQLIAGARVPVADRFEASLRYRYFQMSPMVLKDTLDRSVRFRPESHSVTLGLAFRF